MDFAAKKRGVNQNTGRRLAEVRTHRGWSQQQFADAIGVRKSTIQHLERCRAAISADRLLQFSEALNCRAADILAPVGSPLPLEEAAQ